MEPFSTFSGLAAPLPRDNVDTDAILPKQFLKSVSRTGFGPYLFDSWRFLDEGYFGKAADERNPNPAFVLNDARYRGATILVAGRNFGCGSSREHAPWALIQYGFRVVIATSFADIFFNNCCKNGILPVTLSENEVASIFSDISSVPGCTLSIDLPHQTVQTPGNKTFHFQIPPSLKSNMIGGIDEVDDTLKSATAISNFEEIYLKSLPWI